MSNEIILPESFINSNDSIDFDKLILTCKGIYNSSTKSLAKLKKLIIKYRHDIPEDIVLSYLLMLITTVGFNTFINRQEVISKNVSRVLNLYYNVFEFNFKEEDEEAEISDFDALYSPSRNDIYDISPFINVQDFNCISGYLLGRDKISKLQEKVKKYGKSIPEYPITGKNRYFCLFHNLKSYDYVMSEDDNTLCISDVIKEFQKFTITKETEKKLVDVLTKTFPVNCKLDWYDNVRYRFLQISLPNDLLS